MKTTRFCCLYLTVKTCSFHQFCFSIFLRQTVPMLQNHILLIFLSTISPDSTTLMDSRELFIAYIEAEID